MTKLQQNQTQVKPQVNISDNFVQCNICDVRISNKSQLNTHVRLKHVDVIKFACDKCSYTSSTESKLNEHEQNLHPKEQDIFTCKNCQFNAESLKDLDAHELVTHLTICAFIPLS